MKGSPLYGVVSSSDTEDYDDDQNNSVIYGDHEETARRRVPITVEEEEAEEDKHTIESRRNMFVNVPSDHRLTSTLRGESEVEQMAQNISKRVERRVSITKSVRDRLLDTCSKITVQKGYHRNRIHLSDLIGFRNRVHAEVQHERERITNGYFVVGRILHHFVHDVLRIPTPSEQLLMALTRAVEQVQEYQLIYTSTTFAAAQKSAKQSRRAQEQEQPAAPLDTIVEDKKKEREDSDESQQDDDDDSLYCSNEYFYFQDFVFDHTHPQSRWPWMRPGLHRPILVVVLFYLLTPIWFCHVYVDDQVCDRYDDGGLGSGWISALYFASMTLSTVGYGDVTVSKDDVYKVFVGILYMIISNFVLIVAFASAVDQTFDGLKSMTDRIINRFLKQSSDDDFLHKQIRRVRLAMLAQLSLQYLALNLFGVLCLQIHIWIEDDDEDDVVLGWSFMTMLYWALQSTTTIGYGDLTVGEDFRWFQIFYLIISTYFVGNALTGFATLQNQVDAIRRKAAWSRREVSKAMIDQMQAYEHDGNVDQFEFTVASLVQLGKIDRDDVTHIMDRYRALCDTDGFIRVQQTLH